MMVVFADEKTCTQCPTTMPSECFPPNGKKKDGTSRRHPYCYPCKRASWNAYVSPEKRRENSRKQYRKQMADPERAAKLREQWNASKKRQMRRDPEDFRRRNSEASRRYHQRLMEDPVRAAQRRQDKRIDDTLRRRRLGMKEIARKRRDREFEEFPMLPARPLVAFLEAEVRKLEASGVEDPLQVVAGRCEVSPRKIYAWMTGELVSLQFDTADKILVSLNFLPWDIWDEDEYPEVMRVFGFDG